jgi:Fibrobacter succinogenes major domain (Fib_succ_major).
MDRNLGATSVTPASITTFGLLYQWGRKDPFPGYNTVSDLVYYTWGSIPIFNSSGVQLTEEQYATGTGVKKVTVNAANNLTNSIQNPLTFYCGISGSNTGYDWYTAMDVRASQNDALWGGSNASSPTSKTIYDPCPAGWRVPVWKDNTSPWVGFDVLNPGGTNDTQNEYLYFPWSSSAWDSYYGRTYINGSISTYYPAAGARSNETGLFYGVGEHEGCWSGSSSDGLAYNLACNSGIAYSARIYNRSSGLPVRCCKE